MAVNDMRRDLVVIGAVLALACTFFAGSAVGADVAPAKGTTGTALAAAARVQKAARLGEESLVREALEAMRAGVRYLDKSQQADGSWSNASFPAITGLAVTAILRSPDVLASPDRSAPESVGRGLKFILSNVRDNGGIYRDIPGVKGGGLTCYNTALSLMALAEANDSASRPVMERARGFLVRSQHLAEGDFRGGMGYDAATSRPYADMTNTVFALDALRRTESLERASQDGGKFDWQAAVDFLSHCQHLKATNPAAWVKDTPEELGGFIYHPLETKLPLASSPEGVSHDPAEFRSFGSVTVAGLYGYRVCGVDAKSPRVQGCMNWLERSWSLDENPRMGLESLYYYYMLLAQGLDAAGQEVIEVPGKEPVRWRPALVHKLITLQKLTGQDGAGYWQNENNRWMENDPNLMTAFALIAMESATFGNPEAAPTGK
jgi:squalene-hopene/tetraprenyl-beta-curcumene cyclase